MLRALRRCGRWLLAGWLALLCGTASAGDGKCLSLIERALDGPTIADQGGPVLSLGNGRTLTLRSEVVVSLPASKTLVACLDGKAEPTLFLDHLALRGLPTTGRRVGPSGNRIEVTYRLERPGSGAAAWNELLLRAWRAGGARTVKVGLGADGTEVVALGSVTLRLGTGNAWSAGVALGAGVAVLLLLAWVTRALEDRRAGFTSYSLSRLMLGCWVVTTSAVVIVMWRHTEALPSLADGGLAFMLAACGLGTGLSTWLDQHRQAVNTKPTRFLADLLFDGDGLALHRLQALLFNGGIVLFVQIDTARVRNACQINNLRSVTSPGSNAGVSACHASGFQSKAHQSARKVRPPQLLRRRAEEAL